MSGFGRAVSHDYAGPKLPRVAYKCREVGEMLGFSRAAILRYVRAGLIPAIELDHEVRIPRWWVEEMAERPKPLRRKDFTP